jgi:hypothetical protein
MTAPDEFRWNETAYSQRQPQVRRRLSQFATHRIASRRLRRFTQLTEQITIAEGLTRSAASASIATAGIDTHVVDRDDDERLTRSIGAGSRSKSRMKTSR